MKRTIFSLFALAAMLVMSPTNVWADDASEMAAANTAINNNGSYYKIKTTFNETTYYIKSDGTLTSNSSDAATLTFNARSVNGYNGFEIYIDTTAPTVFTNPTGSETSPNEGTSINIRSNQSVRDFDTQVLYYEGSKYAIRATAVNNNKWGCYTFWNVKDSGDGVIACYDISYTESDGKKVGTKHYIWELEAVEVADAPVVNKTIGKSYYKLNMAFNGFTNADTELELNADQTLSGRLTWSNAHTLTITPKRDVTIKAGGTNYIWILSNKAGDGGGQIDIGNTDYAITFDGDNKSYSSDIIKYEQANRISVTNATFKNFTMSAGALCTGNNTDGKLTLKNITFTNCTAASGNALIDKQRVTNDKLELQGYLNVDADCSGTVIKIAGETKSSGTTGRILVSDDAFSASNPVTIAIPGITGSDGLLIIKGTDANSAYIANKFRLSDYSFALKKGGSGHTNEVQLSTSLSLNDLSSADDALGYANAGAVTMNYDVNGFGTLVVPFDATWSGDVAAYSLTNIQNSDEIWGEAVTELTANEPVLLNGTGTLTLTKKAEGTAEIGETLTNGLLTGVYTSTTAEAGWYVLQKHDETYGFYQVNETTPTIKPFRAYMPGTLGGGAKALTFNLDGTDALQTLTTEQTAVREVYTLGGTRINTVQRGVNLLRMQDGSVRKVIVK